jgi:Family of unknown function (DUF6446)
MITAILAGLAMYYLQVYAFYDPVQPASAEAEMRLTTLDGVVEPILADNFAGIDSDSSPIRFRACFTTPQNIAMLTETYKSYPAAVPLTAPGWFDCFDAATIGDALEQGKAVAFLGEENISYGIDRVVAVFGDGRAFAWNQINACGDVVFSGAPAPAGCPPAPLPGE